MKFIVVLGGVSLQFIPREIKRWPLLEADPMTLQTMTLNGITTEKKSKNHCHVIHLEGENFGDVFLLILIKKMVFLLNQQLGWNDRIFERGY